MAALESYLSKVSHLSDFHLRENQSLQMLSLCLLVLVTSLSILALSLSLLRRRLAIDDDRSQKQRETEGPTRSDPDGVSAEPDRPAQALVPERLFGEEGEAERVEPEGDRSEGKKKKKRAKRKSSNSRGEEEEGRDNGEEGLVRVRVREKEELVCLYPFTSSSSVTQRKIKQQYDQLMKSHHSKGLSLTQVGQFANCLVEAKNELQHKADIIQRKFTITKALLFKADRSSFDRLRQQIYKLELEQKRLEEDAFVYNWLQQQLKLSPAYKKMLEIGARMELKAKSGELLESTETDDTDISFEELLAQEKKDSFWLKNGKLRPCSG